jgi:hypothetical protein
MECSEIYQWLLYKAWYLLHPLAQDLKFQFPLFNLCEDKFSDYPVVISSSTLNMDHQSWSHLIAQQETGLATCRSSIESSSTVTNLAIIDGKSTVVSHLKASFSDLVVLTRYIDGDYDSRIKAKELPPASSENSAIASLVNNAETAVVKSDAISKQVQLEVVQVLGNTVLG